MPCLRCRISTRAALLVAVSLVTSLPAAADPVAVKHPQGEVHAFLSIRDENGKLLGYADEVNVRAGRAWRSRLTIRFKDGSLSDETSVYTQGESLHLLTDHLVQKGPSFPKPSDVTIDTAKSVVTYHEQKDGSDQVKTETLNLPEDLANGLLPPLMQNYPVGMAELKVGYLVMAPKPRVVKFAIHPEGAGRYTVGTARSANHYRIHIDIGGIEGAIAPVIGKEPPDIDAWVSSGEAPTFLKMCGILFLGGPLWTLQLASPQW